MSKLPLIHIVVTLLMLEQDAGQKHLQEGRVRFDSRFDSTVHHDGKAWCEVFGAAGCFASVVRKQTEWDVDAWLTFSFFVQPWTSAHGVVSPIFNVVMPTWICPI